MKIHCYKKLYKGLFLFLVIMTIASDLAYASDQKSRLDDMSELKSVHNNGIACDFFHKSHPAGKPIATHLIPQKKLWINLGRQDIAIMVADLIASGMIIGFRGKIDRDRSVEATKIRSLEDKDGLSQDEYTFAIKHKDSTGSVINAISQCDA